MSTADRLVLGGAVMLLVVGDWFLGAFLGGGAIPVTSELAAAEILVLLAVRYLRPRTRWVVPYVVILAVLTAAILAPAVYGLLSILRDVRALTASSPVDLLLTVTGWIATALLGAGTWLAWHDDAA